MPQPPEDEHHFDRRKSDVNVAALALRVDGLETRMGNVEEQVRGNRRELEANTALTEDIHGKAAEMYAAFETGRNALRVAGTIGDGVMFVADRAHKIGKGAAWGAVVTGLIWGLATGKIPGWVEMLLKAIV